MLISKITLHNYSTFEGTQVFEFPATENTDQNIILIGGTNGAGKTSLLEAVKMCLYGDRGSGLLNGKESPAEFIQNRFNYNARDRGEVEMQVELVFDHVLLPGANHQIQVCRTWRFHALRGTYIGDEFTIKKDDQPLQIIDREHWQDFINETIPPGIASFFFFDGEKIQQLANDNDDRAILRESIRTLLGLTIYSRLSNDLAKHIDDIRRLADKVTDNQIKQLEEANIQLINLIRTNEGHRNILEEELKRLENEDQEIEQEIRRIAGVKGNNRDNLQKDIAEAETEKRGTNERIIKIAGELLPFAIAGRICEELRTQLEAEEEVRQWDAARALVQPQVDRVIKDVFLDSGNVNSQGNGPLSQRDFYMRRLRVVWETLFIETSNGSHIIHQELSPKDVRLILSTLDKVSSETVGVLRNVLKQRELASRRLQDASRVLRSLPEDNSHFAEQFDKRKSNEDRRQQIYRELGKLDDEHSRYEREYKSNIERISNLKQKLDKFDFDRRKVEVSRKIQVVLERYEQELQGRKLMELENLTTEMYRHLAHKDDFVGRVKIDPITFEVSVEDSRGQVRKKNSLSAGEKQIYAISLLWALSQSSNVELPVMIDTPFARLDREHRTNISKHYFPRASQQVIILSTDEEIDQRYIELLRPYIARTYLVEHKDSERKSVVRTGYFYQL